MSRSASFSAKHLVERLRLTPHPEGGFYREIYRSGESIPQSVLPNRYTGDRVYSTLIYYLLPKGSSSHLHRLKSDEIWHFYFGDPLTLIQIDPSGAIKQIFLGHELNSGHQLCAIIPAGCWFGAFPSSGSDFSLVGATVAPGFDFSDFEMGDRKKLLATFPHAKEWILKLT